MLGLRPMLCLLIVAVAVIAGCGGSDESASDDETGADQRQAIERTLSEFAVYVGGANIPEMCTLLVGQARRDQGCGTNAADLGPQLRLAIDEPDDLRLQAITGDHAVASFPDYRQDAVGPDPEHPTRQKLILVEVKPGTWKIVRIVWGPR